ncbi:laccase-1 [Cinnamomum micranthum f. kanehirae]|uniref:Laccase-1 n=1 Tax=Cinnamomum micranthum f. kanehirae TaxID=337451 RepID=A0A3S3N683_9MAGN|nr:laccase-1 [Cinnamomum micranthum f. kanehirae]
MAATPYVTAIVPFDGSTTHKTPQFPTTIPETFLSASSLPCVTPLFNTWFSKKLRSLDSSDYPCKVPRAVDKQVFLTVSLNLQDCPLNQKCKGFLGKRFSAFINNQSFVRPAVSTLESHYHHLHNVELLSDFPEKPPHPYNYTGAILPDTNY